MKKVFKLIITSILLSSINAFAITTSNQAAETIKPINRIVAVINTEIITQSELDKAMKAAKDQFQSQGIPIPDSKTFKSKILDSLIMQKLQLELANQNKIKVTDKEINTIISQIAKQNHLTMDQLKQKLKQENIIFDHFRNQIKDQLIIRNLQQQAVISTIKINKAEIKTFKEKLEKERAINNYLVIDYLLPIPLGATDTVKAQALQHAKKLIQQLKAGKTISTNKNIEVNSMGYRPLSDLPDLFSKPLTQMGKTGVSQPILAGNGYHVLHLLNVKNEAKTISDKEAQQLLFQQKFQKNLEKWLEKLRKQAYVKIYLKK